MLSKRAQELLDLLTGKKAVTKSPGNQPQFWLSRPVENVKLKEGTVAFIKSVLPAKTVAGALAAKGAVARVARVGGGADLQRGFQKLTKRAAMVPITDAEMQGATPSVAPAGKPRGERGLSDADLQALEAEITAGPVLAPAQAAKLFLQPYRVIAANPARRLTEESAAYGVPAAPGGYPDRR